MSKLIGRWQYVSKENAEGALKALGASEERIQKMLAAKPYYTISKDGDTWTVKVEITEDWTKEYSFKCGKEFESKNFAEYPVKTILTVDGNVLTEVQKLVGQDKEVKIIRTAGDTFLVGEMLVDDQKVTVTFKRA